MNLDVIIKSLTTLMSNDIVRQGAILGVSVLGTGCYVLIKKGNNKRRELMSITDLKKRSKRFRELHYGKQSSRGAKD